MNNNRFSEEDKKILQDAIRAAEDIILFEDESFRHGFLRMKNGLEAHYIENKSDNSCVLDLDMTIKANGYSSIDQYLIDKPYMTDVLLDGLNSGKIVIS